MGELRSTWSPWRCTIFHPPSDPTVATFLAEIDAVRLESLALHARHAHATGQLAVPEDECRDVLFATTDGTLWRTLVQRQGWPDDRYSTWLGTLWVTTLTTDGVA
jgi:hypothetical protein